MNDQIFNNLTKEQLYEGASLALKNIDAHFLCANLMAKSGQYGLANSHLILGCEEAIKSVLLFAGCFNIPINTSVSPFFKSHKAKHEVGEKNDKPMKVVFLIINCIELIIRKDKRITIPQLILEAINIITDASEEWWKNANERKNDGFYVGFELNNWKYPQQITKQEYEISKNMTRGIRSFIELIKTVKINDYKTLVN
jgi:AbiV family abortive infection protein